MTLKFIGSVDPAGLARLGQVAERIRIAPFSLTLDRLGYWSHNHILWAGCDPATESLRRLVAALAGEVVTANALPERERFAPHVTLVRQANCAIAPELDRPIDWRVREFVLAESFMQPSGARYRTLKRWPLHEST